MTTDIVMMTKEEMERRIDGMYDEFERATNLASEDSGYPKEIADFVRDIVNGVHQRDKDAIKRVLLKGEEIR